MPMGDDPHSEVALEQHPPRPGCGLCKQRTIPRQQPPDLRIRAEDRHEPSAMLTQRGPRNPRLPALGVRTGVRGGYEATQRRPPHGTGSQEGHPWLALIDPRATACRCSTPRVWVRTGVHARRFGGLDGKVHSEHRRDAQPRTFTCPPHRGVQAVAIGQTDDGLPNLGSPLHKRLRQCSAVTQRVTRGNL